MCPLSDCKIADNSLYIACRFMGWQEILVPLWVSFVDFFQICLRLLCTSSWNEPTAGCFSQENRVQLPGGKSWSRARHHLLEIKGTEHGWLRGHKVWRWSLKMWRKCVRFEMVCCISRIKWIDVPYACNCVGISQFYCKKNRKDCHLFFFWCTVWYSRQHLLYLCVFP